MRALTPPPLFVVDSRGSLQTGSFRGPLPKVDLAPLGKGSLYRAIHHKRWIYVALSDARLFCGLAVVDLGYAKSTFAFVYEDGILIADRSALASPTGGGVSDGITPGFHARFTNADTHVQVRRPARALEIEATFPGLALRVELDGDAPHPALSAIGPVPNGLVDATEKHALLKVRGEIRLEGRTRRLDGAYGGWDYTNGYLARHTKWRWGYLMGRARSGEEVAMNLVEGFLGERECGVWANGELFGVGEGRFGFDPRDPLQKWTVRSECGAVDLRFSPGAMHAESTDFKVLRSKFVQPIGRYEGTIRVGGRSYEVDALGVAEDQDVLW